MNNVWVYQFVSGNGDCIEPGLEQIGLSDMNASEFRDTLADFLRQTNDAYVDKYGVLHEIYDGVDRPFAYYMDVCDNDWMPQIFILYKYLMSADVNARVWLSKIKSAVLQKAADFGYFERTLPLGNIDNYDAILVRQ